MAELQTVHHIETDHPGELAHHFEDLDQQRDTAELGMWLFLATEFMFFGGVFMAYLAYRYWHPEGFAAASHTMDVMLGTINTAVLLTSSLTMALAVHAAHHAKRTMLLAMLLATTLLGLVFLAIKAYEYHHKYVEQHVPIAGLHFHWPAAHREGAEMFFALYFAMTGLHAFHMLIGIVMLLILCVAAWRGKLLGPYSSSAVHNVGLYWHFVDLVWVYLFPFLYLVAAR